MHPFTHFNCPFNRFFSCFRLRFMMKNKNASTINDLRQPLLVQLFNRGWLRGWVQNHHTNANDLHVMMPKIKNKNSQSISAGLGVMPWPVPDVITHHTDLLSVLLQGCSIGLKSGLCWNRPLMCMCFYFYLFWINLQKWKKKSIYHYGGLAVEFWCETWLYGQIAKNGQQPMP